MHGSVYNNRLLWSTSPSWKRRTSGLENYEGKLVNLLHEGREVHPHTCLNPKLGWMGVGWNKKSFSTGIYHCRTMRWERDISEAYMRLWDFCNFSLYWKDISFLSSDNFCLPCFFLVFSINIRDSNYEFQRELPAVILLKVGPRPPDDWQRWVPTTSPWGSKMF